MLPLAEHGLAARANGATAEQVQRDDAETHVRSRLAIVQGAYFALTGIWSLFGVRTFQMVTGPKHDVWLVKTVGVLVSVIGAMLVMAGLRRRTGAETELLAAGSAAGLAGIDIIYVAKGTIRPVYLLDAVAEAGIAAAWVLLRGERARMSERWLRRASTGVVPVLPI